MEIQVYKLREALDLLKPVVPKKPTLSVLGNVLLEGGTLRATDLEVGVAIEMAPFHGEYLLPYQKVVELLKRVPGHQTLTVEQNGRSLKLSWPNGEASYDTEAKPKDFPPFPKTPTATTTLDGDILIPALVSVLDYTADGANRPVLSGVFLLLGEHLEVAAADGFRLAVKALSISLQVEGMETAVIPAQTVRVLEHLARKAPRDVPQVGTLAELVTAKRLMRVTMDKTILCLTFGKIQVSTHLIQGTPPDYRALIPKESAAEVMVMAPELERAVRSVTGIARDSSGIVRLSWTETAMTVNAGSEDSIQVSLPVQSTTEGRVALNIQYLLQYLNGKASILKMTLAPGHEPVTLMHGNAPLVLVMPMDVQWDNERHAETAGSVTETGAETEEQTEVPAVEVVAQVESDIEEKVTIPVAPEPEPKPQRPPVKKPRKRRTPAKA